MKFINKYISITDSRSKQLHKNSIIIIVCQFLSTAVNFLLVPLILKILGKEEYGIWVTLIGILEWFAFFDIGLGHGLRNKYVESKLSNNIEEVLKYISTTFFMLLFISSVIFTFFSIFAYFSDWSVILNAPIELKYELKKLALFLGFIFSLRFIINIVFVLLTADQSPGLQSIILLMGNFFALLSIFIISNTNIDSILTLGVIISSAQTFPILFAFIFFFLTKYFNIRPSYRFFSKTHLKDIFSLGIKFFLIQITALILFYTNNIIISHISGNIAVTEYSVAFKYTNTLYVIFMGILTPVWSACTEAYLRNDLEWIQKTISRINKIWLIMVLLGLIFLLISPIVYKFWLGTIQPDYKLIILLVVYFIFTMKFTIYRTFMNGVGKIRLQFFITSIEAVLHIPLAILLGRLLGFYGVVITMILWAIFNCIWEPIQFKKIMNNNARGIWNK